MAFYYLWTFMANLVKKYVHPNVAALCSAAGITNVVKYIAPRPFMSKCVDYSVLPIDTMGISATLSKVAYHEPSELYEDTMGKPLLDKTVKGYPKYIHKDDTQAYVWKFKDSPNTLHVVFRGTSSLSDAIDDMDVRTRPLQDTKIQVHAGFLRQFKDVEDQIMLAITKEPSIETIVCSGHSLGGALATLAAPILASRFSNVQVHCFTCGSPRVGNTDFCKWYESLVKNTVRVTNENDPVPMVPITHRFTHVVPAICIDDHGQVYHVTSDMPWYMRPFYSSANLDYTNLIQDHDCALYIKRIQSMHSTSSSGV